MLLCSLILAHTKTKLSLHPRMAAFLMKISKMLQMPLNDRSWAPKTLAHALLVLSDLSFRTCICGTLLKFFGSSGCEYTSVKNANTGNIYTWSVFHLETYNKIMNQVDSQPNHHLLWLNYYSLKLTRNFFTEQLVISFSFRARCGLSTMTLNTGCIPEMRTHNIVHTKSIFYCRRPL